MTKGRRAIYDKERKKADKEKRFETKYFSQPFLFDSNIMDQSSLCVPGI